ncbi:hypothetical protein [Comamonas sp. MYb69]|uniref:hypothetical protein n=1 Tax=Comamonas sp. MYb69 TaxID=1848650 RepID=UPI0030A6C5B2
MTTMSEKLAQELERFAALLRSGEWDAEKCSWSPEYDTQLVGIQLIDDAPHKQKTELVRQEVQFTLARSAKKERA